ncbi:hypothetical protein ASD55_10480 [Rhodanobacter sp. Root561]|nr:hypothetical protein ASD55_10480 [Rhodanobacter sp. Root561]
MSTPENIYFSDDLVEAALVCNGDGDEHAKPSISTVDFIELVEREESIATLEAAKAIAKLIELKIGGVPVAFRYVTSAVEYAKEDQSLLEAILDGLWDASKPYKELLEHFGNTAAYTMRCLDVSDDILGLLWMRWLKAVRFQSDRALKPLYKLGHAFVAVLRNLPDDEGQVRRLWQLFWKAIELGLASTLNDDPDKIGAKMIGDVLGRTSIVDPEYRVSNLSQKAKLGLPNGTALLSAYEQAYVEAAAEATIANIKKDSH